jgi:hypothetical protein
VRRTGSCGTHFCNYLLFYFFATLQNVFFYLQQGHIICCVLLPSYTLAPIQKNTGFYSKCKTVQNDHKNVSKITLNQRSLDCNGGTG